MHDVAVDEVEAMRSLHLQLVGPAYSRNRAAMF